VDIRSAYHDQIRNLKGTGYGIFAKYNGFTVNKGQLVPIRSMDTQTLDSLYGYERERNLVLENTRALVEGGKACNVLLYGDAGTGKSSTIKACARHFFDRGLRIVEFKKDQLDDILPIMEFLSEIPLKFIFYIDDLSFNAGDDSFCALKGILEGSAASYAGNIAIYATSNRRHLIKESMEDRVGDSLHINDTMQETMSLAARFGLSITFSKPAKDLYLEIVKSLAAEYGVDLPEEELFRRAEAFAIRQNGRSPRTAKQFLQLTKIGL
jgi:predicted AAA+ superfamily ATPase